MKQLLPAFIACVIGMPVLTHAQTAPNGDFESRMSFPVEDPVNYSRVSNDEFWEVGQPNATKTTDAEQGTYAIKLQTIVHGQDTIFGYCINGDPENMSGGIPYNQQPTSFDGYYKNSVPAGDTAIVLVIFKKNGSVISMNEQKFTGTHNSYTAFSLPISLSQVPDTVIIGAASSNAMVFNGIPGSTLKLDNLMFSGVTSQPALFNGDFENWITRTFYKPAYWQVDGDSITTSTMSHSGTYCLMLTNVQGNNSAKTTRATTGHFLNNGGVIAGCPFSQMMDTLCFWYKFIPAGNDSASVWFQATSNMNMVGGNGAALPAASSYTFYKLPIMCGMQPDTASITFSSNSNYLNAPVGSVLYVDDVYLKSQPLSTGNHADWSTFGLVNIYPNPATDRITIDLPKGCDGIRIIDATGRIVYSENTSSTGFTRKDLSLDNYSAGIYSVQVFLDGKTMTRKVVVQ